MSDPVEVPPLGMTHWRTPNCEHGCGEPLD